MVSAPSQVRAIYCVTIHFLGLGAQRAGTTSLHALLRGHPQLALPRVKELHYFSHHFDGCLDWYSSHFKAASCDQKRGEITPYYLFHPLAPARIHALLPSVRLLVLLRDPVQRTISHYRHACRLGFERLPLAMALEAEPARLLGAEARLLTPGRRDRAHQELSYVARSRYHEQLYRYLQLFPRDQLLVIQSERFFAHPERVSLEITRFLDIEPHPAPGRLPRLASTLAYTISDGTRRALARALQETYEVMADCFDVRWPV
jgi:hypothetical protein